ncbi:MAG: class A beta-lactamase-related serine hydrolase, partial [Oxalobacteraceae bacterium]
MKDNGNWRPARSVRLGLMGMLLPLALSSTAQTPLRWESAQTAPVTPARYQSPTQPQAYRTNLAEQRVLPLAQGFDVAAFESMASAMAAGERVPGLAMAIVQNGRVLSARGYGVTDVKNPQLIDSHTVFRLASLSKAFAGTMTGLLV